MTPQVHASQPDNTTALGHPRDHGLCEGRGGMKRGKIPSLPPPIPIWSLVWCPTIMTFTPSRVHSCSRTLYLMYRALVSVLLFFTPSHSRATVRCSAPRPLAISPTLSASLVLSSRSLQRSNMGTHHLHRLFSACLTGRSLWVHVESAHICTAGDSLVVNCYSNDSLEGLLC